MKNKWYGVVPTECNICNEPIKETFVDGRTKTGFWAIMCPACHKEFGVGLGIGRGQEYKIKVLKDGDKEWKEVKKNS